MNKTFIAILYFLIFAPFGVAGDRATEVPQKGYTTIILREPVFNMAKVAVETTRINNWLNLNYKKLTYEQMKGPREHLYYLIDSYMKDRYAREKRILPREHDRILEVLFSWAERLGVYGGTLVYNAIKSPKSAEMEPLLKLPDQISLTLEGDLLSISASAEGWSVKIPYYFMIWNVNDFTATNGLRTQLVALSTGATLDKSETGHSQATLMLMYSPGAEPNDVAKYWKKGVGIGEEAEKKSIEVDELVSFYSFDSVTKLHKEITIWRKPQGAFAVAYLV